jgi:UDP-N-acetylmuramate--alanine ligase
MNLKPHVHFIGIGGSGLSAIARVLLESGRKVSGSDRQSSATLQSLEAAGARVYVGHRAENVSGASLVVRSSAIPNDNVEVQAAQQAGIPVLKRSDFLGQLLAGKTCIAIAGTHGKTTTTAMIAWILTRLGQSPSFIVGGHVKGLETNAGAGDGEFFVIEADEYDSMFLGLNPKIAIVTSMEFDHPDCYPTREEYRAAFSAFSGRVSPGGVLFGCGDDLGASWLIQQALTRGQRALTYGISSEANVFQAHSLSSNKLGGFDFDFWVAGPLPERPTRLAKVSLSVPGEHNVRNALAALAVAHHLNLSIEEAAQALLRFQGTGRRFDILGEFDGVTVIDDYAHHPSEIQATLAAARARFTESELWVVWQPHTFSRTQALLDDFAVSFEMADNVIVTEIYAAREIQPVEGFSGQQVARALEHDHVLFMPDFNDISAYLLKSLKPGSIVFVLSAGDADQISKDVWRGLKERKREDA